MAAFKVGDLVQVSKTAFSKSWKEVYNLDIDRRYQIVKVGRYNTIKSVDPKEPIKYKDGAGGEGTMEMTDSQLVMDEDFIKERLEQLFG
jgi:hypothetical protein